MRRTNNKGFSYVEMLMVLAIMAIMIGMVTISVGLISRNTVSRTLEKVESLCNRTRINALTKGSTQGYLNMAQFSDGVYAYVGEMVMDDNIDKIREKGERICSNKGSGPAGAVFPLRAMPQDAALGFQDAPEEFTVSDINSLQVELSVD